MHSSSRGPGRPRAYAVTLDADSAIPTTHGFFTSDDSNRVLKVVQPSGAKRRRVLPQDVDEAYGDWVLVHDAEGDDRGAAPVASVISDAEAAGKRKKYESSVSRFSYPSQFHLLTLIL